MRICRKCRRPFPSWVVIDGARHHLASRSYCLDCSPFGQHNTSQLHLGPSRRKQERACLGCGQPTKNPKYCSNRCQRAAGWREAKALVEQTGVAANHPRIAKRFVLERQGRVCAICGLTTWCGKPVPLVLDHINGIADDWHVDNLRLVCGNCDMQLPTFKSKNRGKGRAWRRQRYSEGKSY